MAPGSRTGICFLLLPAHPGYAIQEITTITNREPVVWVIDHISTGNLDHDNKIQFVNENHWRPNEFIISKVSASDEDQNKDMLVVLFFPFLFR
jgi:hypothetical protein